MLYQYGPVTITTSAAGAATVYFGSSIRGRIVCIKYTPGTIETGATLTFTGATTAVPILTKANAGTSEVWYFPQAEAVKVADGAAITDGQADVWVYLEQVKLVVASGGATKTGTAEVWTDEEQ